MVFLLSPVFVALLALAIFRDELPAGLWPALTLMLAGAGIVVYAKATAAAHGTAAATWVGVMAWGAPQSSLPFAATATAAAAAAGGAAGAEQGGGPGLLAVLLGLVGPGGGGHAPALTWRDGLGLFLSLLSALALASFMLLMQVGGWDGPGAAATRCTSHPPPARCWCPCRGRALPPLACRGPLPH